VTFRSGRKQRKTVTCVTSLSQDDVPPRTSAHWHNHTLDVPDQLPPSTTKSQQPQHQQQQQRNIDIRYTLAVRQRAFRRRNPRADRCGDDRLV